MKRAHAMSAICALLIGCASSPPTRFVTLDSVAADAPVVIELMQPVQLTAAHIPAAWDRPQVVRQPAPNRFDVSDTERWAAPLADMMRATLARDLATRLPDGRFVPPDLPAPKGTRSLVVTVTAIGVPVQGDMSFDASWTLVAASRDQTSFMQHATLRVPIAGADATAEAAAMSRALGQLADRIAQSLDGR